MKKREVVIVMTYKEYRYFVAESHGSLSLALITVALLNRSLNVSSWYFVPPAILGIIILLIGLYLILPNHKVQELLLRIVSDKLYLKVMKFIGWAVVLALFGNGLAKMGCFWVGIFGMLISLSAYAVLIIGFHNLAKGLNKESRS